MKWKEQLNGLHAYQPGKSMDEVKKMYGLTEIVKLASNENPFGCSHKVKQFLSNLTANHALYPDGYATNLREALSEKLGISERQLLFGNGSDEIITIISRALLQPGTNSVMAIPSFSQYRHNALLDGAEVREIPLVDGRHNLQAMLEAIDHDTAVVWICSPNNPTGVVIPDVELRSFLNHVPDNVLVVLDEAYFEYITNPAYENTLGYIDKYPNLVILRTFSKAYGLAGFRVGYAMAQEQVIQKLDPVRAPFNNTVLSQAVASVALSDDDFIQSCRIANEKGKKQFEAFCDAHQLHYYRSDTNFIMMAVPADSDLVFHELMKRGFIIRSGNALDAPGYIRVTIGTEEQNQHFLQTLKSVLSELGVTNET